LRLNSDIGAVPRLATQKAASLLGYLVLNTGRRHPREALTEMLWPQRPSENARRSLHTALWQIRHALKQAGLEPAEYLSASDAVHQRRCARHRIYLFRSER
jgi:DNA-binding SARP family transcriptional activator